MLFRIFDIGGTLLVALLSFQPARWICYSAPNRRCHKAKFTEQRLIALDGRSCDLGRTSDGTLSNPPGTLSRGYATNCAEVARVKLLIRRACSLESP